MTRAGFLLLLGIPFLLFTAPASAAMAETEADSLFREANRAYREGRFEEAAAGYERIREEGFVSGELFYNLGNAHFQLEDLGRSMANYQRAARLLPRDADLRANRNLLEGRILDRAILRDRLPLIGLLRSGAAAFTTAEWLIAAEFLYGILLLLLALPLLHPPLGGPFRAPVRAAGTLLLIVALFTAWSAVEHHGKRRGVILPGEVSVRSGPGERFTEEFLLHEGTAVRIQREADGWALVTVSPEWKGWVPADSIEPI
ncbi:MAG: hypothetical protein JW958_06055 [Candidatus Eisenbacteria bacterium]|nr:hypothetical protein [Candidatus Eisenbacteria bacterium]